jgi:hypothetical protein
MMKTTHTHIHTVSHKDIYKHLCENLDSKLSSEECRRIREHIEGCDNCTALLDSLKKTVYLYKEMPMPSLPKQLDKKLFAVIKLQNKKRKKLS